VGQGVGQLPGRLAAAQPLRQAAAADRPARPVLSLDSTRQPEIMKREGQPRRHQPAADLDEAQRQTLQALLTTEQYQEVRPVMITTYERGILQGERRTALLLLETKFGPLSPEVKQRVEALAPEDLRQLLRNLIKAQSLKELRLED
jgi:hypothetical protein